MDIEKDREEKFNKVVDSKSKYKLIVAGAGTGKSSTFEKLLKKLNGQCLALTFINNLASDMRKDLAELADSRTFHSFSRKLLHKMKSKGIRSNFHFFTNLKKIIERDSKILGFGMCDSENLIDKAFQLLIENDGRIKFFIDRSNYYNAVGFDDLVYRVLTIFRENPENIPEFSQIVVDEFQDFNALEVEFIKSLELKSPILIVGDDDQAVYNFKNASPDYLREKTYDKKYEQFSLPYCTRCPKVIVDAVNYIVNFAKNNGLFKNRIDKKYTCFLPIKSEDSQKYPKFIQATCTMQTKKSPYLSKYIEKCINEIPLDEIKKSNAKGYPAALIIGPSNYLNTIYIYLKDKFNKIKFQPYKSSNLTKLDGYIFLLEDERSNLGWRIIIEFEKGNLTRKKIKALLENGADLIDLLPDEFIQTHLKRLELLKRFIENKDAINTDEYSMLENYFASSPDVILKRINSSKDAETENKSEENECFEDDIPLVQLSSYNGCKGLSAGNVFIVGLDQGIFPKESQPTDNELCQLIVAITRTRQQCHLITIRRFGKDIFSPSPFFRWIPNNLLQKIEVNKQYFNNAR